MFVLKHSSRCAPLNRSRVQSHLLPVQHLLQPGALSRTNNAFMSDCSLPPHHHGVMAPRQKVKSAPSSTPNGSRALAKVQKRPPASATRRPPRRRGGQRTPQDGSRRMTPWFTIFSRTIGTSPVNPVLFDMVLHPSSFPGTPYFNGNADFAFRREWRVDFDVVVTAGALVGYRFAVVLDRSLSSPRIVGRELLLNLVANGLGAMVGTTGPSETRTSFSVRGPTVLLSNSPPPTLDLVGFSQGRLIVGTVDSPALGDDPEPAVLSVTLTVLMRVDFTPQVPSPQTLAAMVMPVPPPLPPGPGVPPEDPPALEDGVDLTVTWSSASLLPPGVAHVGDLYLSGNTYWRVDHLADHLGDAGGHGVSPQTWKGKTGPLGVRPIPGLVYEVVGSTLPVWPAYSDWGSDGNIPNYFYCYQSYAGGWVGMVGFASLADAILQGTYPASVRPGRELALGVQWGTSGTAGANPSCSVAFGGTSLKLREVWWPGEVGGVTGAAGTLLPSTALVPHTRTNFLNELITSTAQLSLEASNLLTTWLHW